MEPLLEEINRTRPLFTLTQMLSDIPLTVPSRGHITIQRCYVKVKQVEGYRDETEREEESGIPTNCGETTKTVS